MVLSQGIKNREEKEKEKPSPYEEVSEIEVVTTNGDTVIIFTGVGSRCHLKKKEEVMSKQKIERIKNRKR
jgi:hypothetical protein